MCNMAVEDMEMAETTLVAVRCPVQECGRQMVQRGNQGAGWTPEQAFCGAWWDCPRCHSSILFASKALQAQLAEQRGRCAVEAADDPVIRAGFESWLSNIAYWDGKGYREKTDKRRRASWSKAVVKRYQACDDF